MKLFATVFALANGAHHEAIAQLASMANNNAAPSQNNNNHQNFNSQHQQMNNNNQQQQQQQFQSSSQQNLKNPASGNYGAYGNPAYAAPLKCWTCDADSFELCGTSGREVQCQANEKSCELEIRQRQGVIMQIRTGCKSTDACKNNMSNNFRNRNPHYTQCRPEAGYTHSVCRQCCDSDNCVKDPEWWYPTTRTEWAYTGEEESYPAAGGY